MATEDMNSKQALRQEMKLRLRQSAIPHSQLVRRSDIIFNRLVKTKEFQEAECIAAYHALKDEVQTSGFLDDWLYRRRLFLPVVIGDSLEFRYYSGHNCLRPNGYGILEPYETEKIEIKELELFIVPGIAFDKVGNRLGRGGGYYDRALANTDKPSIGLCFNFQLVESLPVEAHDRKVTMVITD
jgi:5-formyltetrahydrofolate cyclo-ligase